MSTFGVVVIGRNEGERLKACLGSVIDDADAVVYVDSGSTDDSVAYARSKKASVVNLDTDIPFTAARARNEGFKYLQQTAPQLDFVQFVDGDCEVVAGWLATAAKTLEQNPQVGVVAGRRRERHPDTTIYNRLCDMEWDTPVGEVNACGGDAMFRITAFQQAGAFNEAMIAGEEPELCVRMRQKNWKVLRIDAEMTLHDAAITNFSQWWKRVERSGHACAEGAKLHGHAPIRHNVKSLMSISFWGGLLPIAMLVSTTLALLMDNVWRTFVFLGFALYALLLLRVFLHRQRRGDKAKHAFWYAIATVAGKFPQALGAISLITNHIRGKRRALIEYK